MKHAKNNQINSNKTKQTKSSKGITLISLVVTIIVLLILAGITIAALTGENGILNKANEAKTQTIINEEKEQIALAYYAAMIETQGNPVTAQDIQSQMNLNGVTATVEEADGSIKVTFADTGNNYWIEDNGNISDTEPMIPRKLEVGNYIYYPDKNGNKILCKVLYNNQNYGVQLVALNPVDTVTLGYDDPTMPVEMASESNFEKAKYSYNNAIKTLNDKAEEYRNSKYTDEGGARCVGSVPNNPYSEASDYFTSSYGYMSSYNGIFKNTDNNYKEDWNQLTTIGSRTITDISKSEYYWLSSRNNVGSNSGSSSFSMNYANSGGGLTGNYLCSVFSGGDTVGYSYSVGFRPVFTLRSNVKIDNIDGKDGTSEDKAYDLK